jgi:L-lactate permease
MKLILLALPALLTGCMAANPVRPVLTCAGECVYYGPQAPDPRVEMARVLTGGVSSLAGIVVGGDVLKSLGSASGATNTIERTVNNSSTDRSSDVTDRSHISTSVTDRSNTSVTDTSSTQVTHTGASE